jgi:tRNA U38,U39,U40 pseudouridine synthase TruA
LGINTFHNFTNIGKVIKSAKNPDEFKNVELKKKDESGLYILDFDIKGFLNRFNRIIFEMECNEIIKSENDYFAKVQIKGNSFLHNQIRYM